MSHALTPFEGRPNGEPRIVILSALDLEYRAVRAHLADTAVLRHRRNSYFEVGRIPGAACWIVMAETGVGNQSAAVATERAIASFEPAAILVVGVAGGLHDDLQIGDVVVGTKIYDYHCGIDSDEGFMARPQSWAGAHDLLACARQVARAQTWTRRLVAAEGDPAPTVHFRPIAAGAVVLKSNTSPLAQRLHRVYNDAAAIEMESAGAAFAAHVNDARVLTVRGISDLADRTKRDTDLRGWQPRAARRAAAFAIALVEELVGG